MFQGGVCCFQTSCIAGQLQGTAQAVDNDVRYAGRAVMFLVRSVLGMLPALLGSCKEFGCSGSGQYDVR
jgi:hypothetical protein